MAGKLFFKSILANIRLLFFHRNVKIFNLIFKFYGILIGIALCQNANFERIIICIIVSLATQKYVTFFYSLEVLSCPLIRVYCFLHLFIYSGFLSKVMSKCSKVSISMSGMFSSLLCDAIRSNIDFLTFKLLKSMA